MNLLQALEERLLPLFMKRSSELVPSLDLSIKSIRGNDEEIKRYIYIYEKKLDELAHSIDLLQKDIEELNTVRDHLTLLEDSSIDVQCLMLLFSKWGCAL